MERNLDILQMNRIQMTSNDTLNGQFKETNTHDVHAYQTNMNDNFVQVKCDDIIQERNDGQIQFGSKIFSSIQTCSVRFYHYRSKSVKTLSINRDVE